MKSLKCHKCGKRACDISDFLNNEFTISIKCPQCKNFIEIKPIKSFEYKKKQLRKHTEQRHH